MSLKATIHQDMIQALKDHDTVTLSVLRLVISAIKNSEIDKNGSDLSDAEVIALMQKQVKQRKEAIELYAKGNRTDLADNEEKEMQILNKYLPSQLAEEEINQIITKTIADLGKVGPGDFGTVMKKVMERARGQAEGSLVSRLVKAKLV